MAAAEGEQVQRRSRAQWPGCRPGGGRDRVGWPRLAGGGARRVGVATALLSLAVAAAACSGASTPAPTSAGGARAGGSSGAAGNASTAGSAGRAPATVLASAATRTAGARTASLAITVTASGSGLPGGPLHATVHGTGVVDFAHHAASLTLSGPGTTVNGVPLQVVVVGSSSYVDAAAVHKGASGFVPASQVSSSSAGAALRNVDLSPTSLSSVMPAKLLALAASMTGVHQVGTQQVAGVETTEIAGTVTNADVLFPGGSTGPSSPALPAATHLWVDGSGRVVRLRVTIDVSPLVRQILGAIGSSGSAGAVHLTATVQEDLSRFGAPVSIPAVGTGS